MTEKISIKRKETGWCDVHGCREKGIHPLKREFEIQYYVCDIHIGD
jgi:hypothetical protein